MGHVIIGVAVAIAAIAAIGYGIAYGLRVSAQRQARELARAAGSAVWQKVADVLNDTVNGRYLVGSSAAASLVAAAHRLLGSDEDDDLPPLFGGATDCLPAASRSARIYGPVGSGKTVCARRIVIQETDAGRHVTVIRTGKTPCGQVEYEFDALSSAQFEAIDAESLAAADARYALALRFNRRDDRRNGIVRPAETILVDDGNALDADALGDLVVRLCDIVATPDNCTRLVVLVNGPDDLCDPPGLFDTEVVLPGEVGFGFDRQDELQGVFDRLSRDELTVVRLAARVSGGGLVTSRHESQILDGLSESTREYLAPRKTQFVEVAMASTDGFQHGILKTPSGGLAEFRLPALADYGAAPIGGTDSDAMPAEPAGWHFHE